MLELELIVPGAETYNEETNEFHTTPDTKLVLKHSLLSISQWESKWKQPFLEDNKRKPKTKEMLIDYVRCMTISPSHVDPYVYYSLSQKNLNDVQAYINDNKTASTFRDIKAHQRSRELVTSELIYYWMVEFGIPFIPCERWHLSRLMTLIRACEVHQSGGKKMTPGQIGRQNEELNRARRAAMHSKG